MYRRARRTLLVLSSAVLMAACGDSNNTPPTTPTPPREDITEVFAGEVNRNGAVTHPFLAEAAGTVTVTLDSLTPEAVSAVGVSLGTWNGTACQIVIANDSAAQGARVIGNASTAGNLCVRIYDVGRIPALAAYQVTVVHP
jgi:hypothetical protein